MKTNLSPQQAPAATPVAPHFAADDPRAAGVEAIAAHVASAHAEVVAQAEAEFARGRAANDAMRRASGGRQ
jgi:hypothetical protein